MKMLQGWKVKLYTFVTLSLFIAGATAALWPRNSVTYTQDGDTKNQPVISLNIPDKDEKKTVEVVGDVNGAATGEEVVPLEDMTKETAAVKDVIVNPPDTRTSDNDPSEPAGDDKPAAQLLGPPAVAKPVTPKKCEGCTVVSLDGLVCTHKSGGLLGTSPCKLLY